MTWRLALAVLAVLATGCTRGSLNNALGTPKNPTSVFSDPNSKYVNDETALIRVYYNVLLESVEYSPSGPRLRGTTDGVDMRRYLAAGYGLSDFYCNQFFTKADESSRRRQYGRTIVNDVGTAVTTILGLVSAGEDAVTALAAVTGFTDSAFRNYDTSFMVSADLSSVFSLVLAAQDNWRARTLGPDVTLPGDFATAHSSIRRYAQLCSTLGMKDLLTRSANKERSDLSDDTAEKVGEGGNNGTRTSTMEADAGADAGSERKNDRPASATPALAPNVPAEADETDPADTDDAGAAAAASNSNVRLSYSIATLPWEVTARRSAR